ncbi:MAG: DUF996 domain-containing protein [Caldimicrobium sp.]|jgi:uncharacterized membrane protein
MTQQNSLSTEKENISKEKLLGGIGSIFMALSIITREIGTLFGILGAVLWLTCLYLLSSKIKNSKIFNKALWGFVLGLLGWIIASIFGLMSFISFFAFSGFMGNVDRVGFGIGGGVIIAILLAYGIFIVANYFYQEVCKILALATNNKLFSTAGLLMLIGAYSAILLIGLIIWMAGWIILAVAFFTVPDEIEVKV